MEIPQSTIKQENDIVSLDTDTLKEKFTTYLYCDTERTEHQNASLLEIKVEPPRVDIKREHCSDAFELKNLLEENNKYIVDCDYRALSEQKSPKIENKDEMGGVEIKEDLDFEECTIDYDDLNIKEEENEGRKSPGNDGNDETAEIRSSSGENSFSCAHCDFKTTQQDLFNSHFHKCRLCEFETFYSSCLKRHLNKSHVLRCDQCDFKTLDKNCLELHMCKAHTYSFLYENSDELVKYKCNFCEFKSRHKASVYRHAKKHKIKKEIIIKDSLSWHEKTELQSGAEESDATLIKCDKCDYRSTNKSTFKRHLLRHTDRTQRPLFKCDKCSYETPSKRYVNLHLKMHKENLIDEDLLRCTECGYETKEISNFKRHQLKHKNVDEIKFYQCKYEKCVYRTVFRQSLERHVASKHKVQN